MNVVEVQWLALLLARAQDRLSPVEIAWVNSLLDRERQKAELEAQLQVQEKEDGE